MAERMRATRRIVHAKVSEMRLVEKTTVVELKAVAELVPVFFATVRSYLKAVGLEHGLILNFAAMPLTIKRVGRELRKKSNQDAKTAGTD